VAADVLAFGGHTRLLGSRPSLAVPLAPLQVVTIIARGVGFSTCCEGMLAAAALFGLATISCAPSSLAPMSGLIDAPVG
jgi:hypothetical protein